MEHLEMRKKIIIMAAVMSAMFFSALNMTIVGTSLPKIVAEIGGMDYFNWVFTIYALTSSITAALVGKLSDIYGRKIFILSGIGIFMVGGLLSGFSGSIYELIAYRGIQGLGGGMIMSTAFTTVGDLFSPRERGRWQGMMGGVFGLSSLFGPTLGGYIVDHLDWSWVFWVFLPIGFVAFSMILKLYPQAVRKDKEKVDYIGSLLLSMVILTLLLGFSWAGTEYAWTSIEIMSLFGVSLISLILFIYVERRVASPVVPLELFKNRVVTISIIVSFFAGMGMFGVIMYAPFYVQGVLGESATTSGLVEMVMTISMVTFSAIAGQWITRTGKYKMLGLIGFSIMAMGMFLNSTLTSDAALPTMIFNLIITGIGLGMTMPIFTLTVQNAVDHKYLGVATATAQLFRQTGATIGVAIMGYVMSSRMSERLAESNLPILPEGVLGDINLDNPQILMNHEAVTQMKADLPAQVQPMLDQLILSLKDALNYSLTQVFLLSTFVVLAALFFNLFLKEIPLRTSNVDSKKVNEKVENIV
ncbi:MDR family MFS transporter [Ammoniphilus sp. CFH 90114]|uniref:MDR family MFS transporter n=1 Tax=Ammoniphilus sp. CFH 90114 TaxID=2493665 RepID=UPI00100DF95F|nr:MDR family MFS transporter [Ammoniphilus sp. CFH 90114]RXT13716.1 DHA2 family efflux MFS transporter permease subunit [Ammoniphilus sp. CFH 90114]